MDEHISTSQSNDGSEGKDLYRLNPEYNFDRLSLDDIKNEVKKQIEQAGHATEIKGLFMVKTVNRWIEQAKLRPIPKMLFGKFWFEGELCILFADTNLGKSILAVQIANSISEGQAIKGFNLEALQQKVLYFDFELSEKQFEARYSLSFQKHYFFNPNFYRAEINPEKSDHKEHGFETFEDFLYHSLEQSIVETEAKVLIIDNITYLKDETEKARFALPLMKDLQQLKKKYGLSILTLAHTPKRDLSKPITRNDLQGSKMLINFADSALAIGESSTDKNVRYLKQIKARSTEIVYDSENVCVCQVTKPYNFLLFEFLNYGTEREHLKQPSEREKTELENQVKKILDEEPGIAAYAIAKRLCPDEKQFKSFRVKVSRIVNRLTKTDNGDGSISQ